MIKFLPSYRYERMLLQPETTSKDDYRFGEIKTDAPTIHKPKEIRPKNRFPSLKYLPTLTQRKHNNVPFCLYHQNKEIIRTHPTDVQKPYVEPPDHGKEHAIKTRPRLVMSPAVSIDDIEDPKTRSILIGDMYTSDMKERLARAIRPYVRVQAPMPSLPAEANPIKLPKIVPPYVSPEWRMESVSWDRPKLRSFCDTTKEFWISKPPSFPYYICVYNYDSCAGCEESKKIAEHNRMMCELKPGRPLGKRGKD